MPRTARCTTRSEEHTSELQSHSDLVCRLLLEKKNSHSACSDTDRPRRPVAWRGVPLPTAPPATGIRALSLHDALPIYVARRVADRVARDGEQPPLSVSVGVAVHPRDGVTLEALLNAADRSLYDKIGRAHV